MPNPRKHRSHFELERVFNTLLQADKNKKLLEMGAGGSIWLPYFAKVFGFDVSGIDYSSTGCEVAQKNLSLAGVKGNIICEDFAKIGETWNDYFDVIVSFGVVEHFNEPGEIIGLMANLLKKGGLVITVAPNTGGLTFKLQKYIGRDVYDCHKRLSLDNLSNYHKETSMQVILERYLQFIDFSVINYQSIFKGKFNKYGTRIISAMNMPVLYLQRASQIYPQSRNWCSSMIVVAKKE